MTSPRERTLLHSPALRAEVAGRSRWPDRENPENDRRREGMHRDAPPPEPLGRRRGSH